MESVMPDPARASTRQIILEAAGRALRAGGVSASVDAIAEEAGVSKSSVLYHFKSKDLLLQMLARDVIGSFRTRVYQHIDMSENIPGKVLRGYVRTIAADLTSHPGSGGHPERWGALSLIRGVEHMLHEDNERWREEFLADGLEEDRALLVWRAADGLLGAALTAGNVDGAEVRRMCDLLIRLSQTNTAV